MNTKIKLPPIDPKYLDFVEGELVVLKEDYDDRDYKRVYKVLVSDVSTFTVEVISEKPINKDKYSQSHAKGNSLMGNVYTADSARFKPYL